MNLQKQGPGERNRVRILTNIKDYPNECRSFAGISVATEFCFRASEFLKEAPNCDVILINCDPTLTLKLVALFILIPFRRRPIVALDIVLRRPLTLRARLASLLKRLLLRRVDHFIHYFRDLGGYDKYFGISRARSSYVPFKTDIHGRFPYTPNPDGDYVLCFGRSERDFDTFIKAMRTLPYPGAIPDPNISLLQEHSSRFRLLSALPRNVRLLENDNTVAGAVRIIAKARVVALPLVAGRISASGIGTYLTAMLLGKCVIITDGPGSSDVLSNEALFVPAEDPDALAATIQRAWENRELRENTANAGRQYAERCGGNAELYKRVLEAVLTYLEGM